MAFAKPSSRNSKKHGSKQNRTAAVSVPFGISHVSKHPKYIRPDKFDEKLLLSVYKHCDIARYQQEFSKFIFEPRIWGQHYSQYKSKFQPTKIKALRCLIQMGTIHAILRGRYYVYHDDHPLQDNTDPEECKQVQVQTNWQTVEISKKSIIESVSQTRMHLEHELFTNDFFDCHPQIDKCAHAVTLDSGPRILLFNNDILDVAIHMMQAHHIKPLVLVMASRSYPGGGYQAGAGAQEEDMCRRTSYFCNVHDPYQYNQTAADQRWDYPLPEYGGVHSPNVLVFRHGADKHYAFFESHPLKVSFVSVYAYSSPALDANNKMSKNMSKRTMKKIESILRIAILHRHKCVVLSAFGSGAYENPPQQIAQCFRSVLNKACYQTFFTHIVFAIIDDKNTGKAHNPRGNIVPYSEVFKSSILSLPNS